MTFIEKYPTVLARFVSLKLLTIAMAVSLLLPNAVRAASVTLAWDANPEIDIASYDLSYGTSSGGYSRTLKVEAPATQVDVVDLQTGTNYFFAVRATNTAGLNGPYSDEISHVVPVPPVPPEGLAAKPGTQGTVVSWLPGGGAAAHYILSYGVEPGNYWETFLVEAPGLETTVQGLRTGVTYYFSVTVTDTNGLTSPPSAELTYRVPVPPAPPSAPKGLKFWVVPFKTSTDLKETSQHYLPLPVNPDGSVPQQMFVTEVGTPILVTAP